ncbi:MAG TPA: AMP-binding protein [Acidimicrobiales bacterium]|nr:AMP-binding protein [Acidimicrobiales bacterium]
MATLMTEIQPAAATHHWQPSGPGRIDDEVRERLATLPIGKAIRARATLTPGDAVVRVKEGGVYRTRTWRQYAEDIEVFARGLLTLGVEPGDTVAIMGDPAYWWMVADAAVISIGAVSFGIYTTCSPEEIRHQVSTAGARVFIAENQEYVDKLLSLGSACPSVEHIVVDDVRALFGYDDERIMPLADVADRGRSAGPDLQARFAERLAATDADDVALLVFTSGTTGPSKAATISHRNFLVGGALEFCDTFKDMTGPGERRVLAHLSLAHAFERIFALYTPILSAEVVHIGEDLESLEQTLFEVQPYYFHAVPRIWQKMAARAVTNIERSSWIKRRSYQVAMGIARRRVAGLWEGKRSLPVGVAYALARLVVFRPMLRKFGLAQARYGLTAGTHVPPEVQRVWQCWGLNLVNGLGMTEVGYVAFQRQRFPKPGSVGQKVRDLEVKVAEDGELLYRGAGVFKGYLGQPEGTAEVITPDGWFHSGDVGRIEPNGEVVLVDRKKDIMITAGGKNITPSLIENLMKASPFMSEFVLIADNRKFPSALVELDYETVSEWAQNKGLVFTGFTSLTQLSEVQSLIAAEIDKGNVELARVEQVKKFKIIPKELDPEEGDTTPTRKVRRRQFESMFQDLIDEMYADEAAEFERLG